MQEIEILYTAVSTNVVSTKAMFLSWKRKQGNFGSWVDYFFFYKMKYHDYKPVLIKGRLNIIQVIYLAF